MYATLIGELAKARVTIEAVANLLHVHRNTVSNKLYGVTPFSLDEALQISTTFFPDQEFQWLFSKTDQTA